MYSLETSTIGVISENAVASHVGTVVPSYFTFVNFVQPENAYPVIDVRFDCIVRFNNEDIENENAPIDTTLDGIVILVIDVHPLNA